MLTSEAVVHVCFAQGVFIMEYCDFLEHFEIVERTQLFDENWVQSAHWLDVRTRPLSSAWQFGDVSCELFLSPDDQHLTVS